MGIVYPAQTDLPAAGTVCPPTFAARVETAAAAAEQAEQAAKSAARELAALEKVRLPDLSKPEQALSKARAQLDKLLNSKEIQAARAAVLTAEASVQTAKSLLQAHQALVHSAKHKALQAQDVLETKEGFLKTARQNLDKDEYNRGLAAKQRADYLAYQNTRP